LNLPSLGVGITYVPELDPLLESEPCIVDLLEIEPQIHWHYIRNDDSYIIDKKAIKKIRSYDYPKTLHSVSSPIGSVIGPDPVQIPHLLNMISYIEPHWFSEHLSFNKVKYGNASFKSGFLLPPLQTNSGINAVIKSINTMKKHINIPFFIENGVNYLKTQEYEIPDGQFVSDVIRATNCGLVLDLHNAYTNELNGRQSVNDFLNTIPLESVWELHLAGGSKDDDYWLDSHGGEIPKPLIDIANSLVPHLVNLRAIVFEIESSHLPIIGLKTVSSELKTLHKVWEHRRSTVENYSYKKCKNTVDFKYPINYNKNMATNSLSPLEWEYTLGSLVVGHKIENPLAEELRIDHGIQVMKKIIASFRSSMVVSVLRLTSRLLMLTLGKESFKELLSDYWNVSTPELFANAESEGFANYLQRKQLGIKYLYDILKLEMSILNVMIYCNTEKVKFQYDPRPIINALMNRKLPDSNNLPFEKFEIEIRPDMISTFK
jgi:uncharacterized protein (UPF0276 family)